MWKHVSSLLYVLHKLEMDRRLWGRPTWQVSPWGGNSVRTSVLTSENKRPEREHNVLLLRVCSYCYMDTWYVMSLRTPGSVTVHLHGHLEVDIVHGDTWDSATISMWAPVVIMAYKDICPAYKDSWVSYCLYVDIWKLLESVIVSTRTTVSIELPTGTIRIMVCEETKSLQYLLEVVRSKQTPDSLLPSLRLYGL